MLVGNVVKREGEGSSQDKCSADSAYSCQKATRLDLSTCIQFDTKLTPQARRKREKNGERVRYEEVKRVQCHHQSA